MTETKGSRNIGYRLGFLQYRCQIDTLTLVPMSKRCQNRYFKKRATKRRWMTLKNGFFTEK